MDLKKDAVDPSGNRRLGEDGNELRLTSGRAVCRGRRLNRMGGVEDHGGDPRMMARDPMSTTRLL